MTTTYVLYLRVSTTKQGQSGLGLEAQREIARRFVDGEGSSIVREYVEVESGKRNDRPVLREALKFAKDGGHTLLVGKLDRLARSVAFVANLLESGTSFRAADLPTADKMMLQMLSVMAEWERDQISKRTKDALAAAVARGVKLGNPNRESLARNRNEWNSTQRAAAKQTADQMAETVKGMKADGLTLAEISEKMNGMGMRGGRGGLLTPTHIHRILKRAG